jgi:1-acyl-sn-glycerol-3-phosphate acyltransferase
MRRVARLIGFLAVCLFFLIYMAAARPFLLLAPRPKRMRIVAECVRLWARACLRVLGLKINAHGFSQGLRSNRRLIVCNHQSYLDVVIIASVFPTLFVAKAEVSRWPLFGWLAGLGGTIFVNREDARSGVDCAYRVSRALREGVNVQVFPEASTSDGATVMPFKGLFFASAIRSQAPALPLTIKFQRVDGRPMNREALDLVCWYGEMDFARHFWRLLDIQSAEVLLMINEPIEPVRARRAKALAQIARERILRSFMNAEAIAAASAEVPVEFARAEDHSTDGMTGNETSTAADYLIGALLFSHFSPGRSETIREATSSIENE